MSTRTNALRAASAATAMLLVGCPGAHDRRVYPINDVAVEDVTCGQEGSVVVDAAPYRSRYGPYAPPDTTRWLGGALAWSRDSGVLVASQDSRFDTAAAVERAPSSEGLVVFRADRSCARPIAFLDAPTDELGTSLAISVSGNLIAATGYVPRALPGTGFEYTQAAAHVFAREGSNYVSQDPISAGGLSRVAFVGERLGVLRAAVAPSEVAVFTLGATASVTDLIRSDDPDNDVNIATSSSGEYAAIVGLSGLVTLVRFDGDTSSFATVHAAGTYDGLPPTVSVADSGRVALFKGEGTHGTIVIIDHGREGPAFPTGWPGYAANPGAAAISPRGDRIAWTMTRDVPTGTNFTLVIASVFPDGTISAPSEVSLRGGCDSPWFVRSVAFASDGRLAVGAMCGETQGGIFIFE